MFRHIETQVRRLSFEQRLTENNLLGMKVGGIIKQGFDHLFHGFLSVADEAPPAEYSGEVTSTFLPSRTASAWSRSLMIS